MVNENNFKPIIENKKSVEIVQEVNNEIPSYEEFMKSYEVDKLVNESYKFEVDSYGDIRVPKIYGPMHRFNRALSLALARDEVSADVAMEVMRLMRNDENLQSQIDRVASNIRNGVNVSVNISIYKIIVLIIREEHITITIPPLVSLPSIDNVTFNTTGSTRPDNYRGVGTWFGLVGNVVGGLIEDSSRHKASGVLFASNRRRPLSF
jgi:hypothetical protein